MLKLLTVACWLFGLALGGIAALGILFYIGMRVSEFLEDIEEAYNFKTAVFVFFGLLATICVIVAVPLTLMLGG